jgi:chlorocatechol 1,2-dioxygenase
MQNDRVTEVANAVIEGVRHALVSQGVSLEEYRTAIQYLSDVAQAGEIPLLCDVFFNITVVETENAQRHGTPADLEGPYYLPDAPFVEDAIKTMPEFEGEPMEVFGQVTDIDGQPLANAVLDIWQSTPDGKYSGLGNGIPIDYYRGKVRTDASGNYQIRSTVPVPYEIPAQGPTGHLLGLMGSHTWRPAHIHFKVEKDGYIPITMQAYFEGGAWVNDDCCSGKCNQGQNVIPERYENGVRLMQVDITLDPARQNAA